MAKADTGTTTFFYPIQYPYSVDKDRDLRDPATPSGHFDRLVNLIPRGQVIRTRGGIEELPHTPDTTGVPYNPLDDADCVMWLRMESNDTIRDCEINGIDYMDMDTGVVTADTSVKYEGNGSGFFNAYVGSPQLRKLTNQLPTGFPACDEDDGYLITFFVSLDWFPPEGEGMTVIRKTGTAGGSDIMGHINFNIVRSAGWSYARPRFIAYDYAGASTDLEADYNFFTDAHVGLWTSKTLGLMGMRLRNAATGANIVDATHSLWNGCSVDRSGTARFALGSEGSLGKFRGRIDDFLAFKNMAALDTIDKINAKIDAIFDRLS
jgi:hypothetical protein